MAEGILPSTASQWAWWIFTTVILAIALSVIGNYATRYTDRWLEGLSERRKKANAKRQKLIENYVEKMECSPDLWIWYQGRISRELTKTYGYLLATLIMVLSGIPALKTSLEIGRTTPASLGGMRPVILKTAEFMVAFIPPQYSSFFTEGDLIIVPIILLATVLLLKTYYHMRVFNRMTFVNSEYLLRSANKERSNTRPKNNCND